jgi:hypothetical protein
LGLRILEGLKSVLNSTLNLFLDINNESRSAFETAEGVSDYC